MKNSSFHPGVICSLALLFACVHSANAQFVQLAGTNVYNFFDTNGTTTASDGNDPSTFLSGQPLPALNYFFGPWTGTIPPTGQVTVNASSVNGSATFNLGANPTGAGGLTLTLNNPTAAPDEVRLDWTAIYVNNSGSGASIFNLTANISGTGISSGFYYALAGGEAIYYNGVTYTAYVGNGYTHAGLGPGPWYGANISTTSYSGSQTVSFSAGGPFVANGDTFTVQGYLDLVVDPGSITVQLQTAPPPGLGIGIYSNSPVVYFPTSPGTNYVLQMTTNLVTGPWVAVTNGVPFTGVEITNAPSPSFFRLH